MGVFNTTWKHIRRSPYQALASVMIMMLIFLALGLFFLMSLSSQIVLNYFERKAPLSVFFTDTKKEADIKSLEEKYKKDSRVAEVKYVSKTDALEVYKKEFKKDPLLLEMVSADILPASLEIYPQKIEFIKEIAEEFKKERDIEEVIYQPEIVDRLITWSKSIRSFGIYVIIFLAVMAPFTIFTIVGMKVALRKREVSILKLVGASSWYVRGSFILEEGLFGLFGAFIGWAINVGLILYTQPFLKESLAGIPLFPVPVAFYFIFLGGMLLLGFLTSVVSSFIALQRYL